MEIVRWSTQQSFAGLRTAIVWVAALSLSLSCAGKSVPGADSSPSDPSRVGPEVVIQRGLRGTIAWELHAYRTRHSWCVRLTTATPASNDDTSECAGSGGGVIDPTVNTFHSEGGMPPQAGDTWFVFGAVADSRIRSVRIGLRKRTVTRPVGLTHEAFPNMRFYAAALAGDEFVADRGFRSLKFYDSSGARVTPRPSPGPATGVVEDR